MLFVNLNSSNFNENTIRRQRPSNPSTETIIIDDSDDEISYNVDIDSPNVDLIDIDQDESNEDLTFSNEESDLVSNSLSEDEYTSENEEVIVDAELDATEQYWLRQVVNKPPTAREFYLTFGSEESCQRFLSNLGIYYGEEETILCGGDRGSPMYLEDTGSRRRWRCNGKIINYETGEKCCKGKERSVRQDSFFSYRKLPVSDVLSILYYWCIGSISRRDIARLVGCDVTTVYRVIRDWYQVLQEDLQVNDCKIGGIDSNGNSIIVEIDESKFGKRKYHRGHRVEGCWVVGGVERTPERKCFLVVVPNRNAATMRTIIETYVNPGSTVYTDCWGAYNDMENWGMDLTHASVNHSVTFRDGDVCTNTIEGTWNGIKINIRPAMRTRKMVPWLLIEFIWRRKHFADIWRGVLKCLKEVSFARASENPPWLTLLVEEE